VDVTDIDAEVSGDPRPGFRGRTALILQFDQRAKYLFSLFFQQRLGHLPICPL
jgi:hypothetical protein